MKLVKDNIALHSMNENEQAIDYSKLDYAELQNLNEYHLYDQEMPTSLNFAIYSKEKLIGEISLNAIRWFNRKADISIYVFEEFRGKGLAQEAFKLLLDYVFNTMNFHRLQAEVMDYNPIVQKALMKFGFKKEGIQRESKFFNGRYYDIINYALLDFEWKKVNSL